MTTSKDRPLRAQLAEILDGSTLSDELTAALIREVLPEDPSVLPTTTGSTFTEPDMPGHKVEIDITVEIDEVIWARHLITRRTRDLLDIKKLAEEAGSTAGATALSQVEWLITDIAALRAEGSVTSEDT